METGQDATALFAVKEEPLDFDMMVKVEDDLELDLPDRKTTSTAVPQIGSSNSAFQPYKQQSLTILTNLQRGNVKTTNKENGPESLTFHEKAAKASLTDADINESNVNAKDPNGFTPLMWAAFHGRLSIVQKLVAKGAQLDCFGPDGETPLMFAACNGHAEVLNYLLQKGASTDTEDDAGNTALMFASYGNHVDCVTELLKRGANMSKPNGVGDTPFEITINKGHLAAQYAMEDFLKEEIEMSISKLSSDSSNNSPITNGSCHNAPTTHCNGGGPSENEGGKASRRTNSHHK
ncbi:Ankyrin repeat family A protein 2 [Orchesella cincta]|uniref:Ankyrin repeat family A protein 2 n=1 Tax=Orchesella cincta TaxID=48709 RepID=A0A1D2N6D2_ORCCI|nr:Ankyrin repeat family A protein 2 [Orchesella cincta]